MSTNIFIYYWKSVDITSKGNFFTEIRGYGKNEENENICIRINNFCTRCFLEFSNTDYLVNNYKSIKNEFCNIIFNKKDQDNIKLVYKKRLYGPTLELVPFIELKFQSRIMMFSFRKKINNLNLKSEIKFHEIKTSSEIQLMAERNLSPTGWVELKSAIELKEHEKVSNCSKEYLISKIQIFPREANFTKGVDLKILSWDIEAKCEDISKNPGKGIDDYVFQISCIFYTLKSKILRKVLLTLGKCNQISDVEVLCYENEKDLILGFSSLITNEQPNIITGWNIFQFDINYLINRAERNMCLSEFTSFGMNKSEGEIMNIKWSSKAFQTTNIKYIDTEGILSIDLLEVVRKMYKLDSYKLNSVSKHFLNEEKDDISLSDLLYTFKCFEENTPGVEKEITKIGKYCVQDSKLVLDLFEKLQIWLSLAEMSRTTSTTIMAVHLHGQQKKFYNQIYRYCFDKNIVVEDEAYKSKLSDNYTGAYVFDPTPGLYSYVVPLDFESLYPSIIIAYNFDYTTLIPNDNNDYSKDSLNIIEWEDHIGCCHDPLVIQKESISRIIENMLVKLKESEHQYMLVKGEDLRNKINQYKKEISKLKTSRSNITKKINKKIICQKNIFKFLKPEVYGKGVMPTIIQNLLDTRKEVKKQMKSVQDKDMLDILNQRQLSYKISANSMYGATGVKRGALPLMPIAMCVTAIGRMSIQKVSQLLNNFGGNIVYGDTDSNYLTFKNCELPKNHEQKCQYIWNKSIEVANEISSYFPHPMRLAFEEVIYYKFMILTKKRYMYYSCNQEGIISKKIGQKGVLLARRDQSEFTKLIYEKTVMNVFEGKSKEQVIEDIFDYILKLLTMQLDWELLKINKSINDFDNCRIVFDENLDKYKMGSYTVPKPPEYMNEEESQAFCISRLPAQVQLEIKRLNRDENKTEGSRLDYVITKQGKLKKQSEVIEEFTYFMQHKNILSLDYIYYIEKLINPLEQIFESIYGTNKFVANNLKYFINYNNCIQQIKEIFAPNLVEDAQSALEIL